MTNGEVQKFLILDGKLGELLDEYQRASGGVWPRPAHKQAELEAIAVEHRGLARQRDRLLD